MKESERLIGRHDQVMYRGKPVRILSNYGIGALIGKEDGRLDEVPVSELEFVDGGGVETR